MPGRSKPVASHASVISSFHKWPVQRKTIPRSPVPGAYLILNNIGSPGPGHHSGIYNDGPHKVAHISRFSSCAVNGNSQCPELVQNSSVPLIMAEITSPGIMFLFLPMVEETRISPLFPHITGRPGSSQWHPGQCLSRQTKIACFLPVHISQGRFGTCPVSMHNQAMSGSPVSISGITLQNALGKSLYPHS